MQEDDLYNQLVFKDENQLVISLCALRRTFSTGVSPESAR